MADSTKTNGTISSSQVADRSTFKTIDTITSIWKHLGLPEEHLRNLNLGPDTDTPTLPSSFKIGHIAQATISLSALTASLVATAADASSTRNATPPKVEVPLRHATLEFASERHYLLDHQPARSPWGPTGGKHPCKNGEWVLLHDSFPNHHVAACKLLGLEPFKVTFEDVSEKTKAWNAEELEKAAMENKAVIYKQRTYEQWDAMEQSQVLPDFPIIIRQVFPAANHAPALPPHMPSNPSKCLSGLRVLELSRVIAAPVAGRTLSAHGADILWITSPNLPALPVLDVDMHKGKRTIQLDLSDPKSADSEKLRELVKGADVFLQGYRPGGIAGKGFSPEVLRSLNPNIIIANLSAWGPSGPWNSNRGFDSIVQNVSGMNIYEGAHFKPSNPPPSGRATPVQILDHAAGYLLATGIMAAVYKRAQAGGGSYTVDVSLAGTGKYLRSLGQYAEGERVFDLPNLPGWDPVEIDQMRDIERESGFGKFQGIKHSAKIEGKEVGWEKMLAKMGSGEARWLQQD